MTELVFLLEELSAQEMLKGLLPRILPAGLAVRYIPFEGKQDLEQQLVRKIRGYRVPGARFVVLRDQDAGNCQAIKARLAQLCEQTGVSGILIRIACRELESWYLADLAAVEQGLGLTGLAQRQDRRKFRQPDLLGSPSKELDALTDGLYQKVGGSRRIGPHLDPENVRSPSFRNLVSGIRRLIAVG